MKKIIKQFRFILIIISILIKEIWNYLFTLDKNIFFINFIEKLAKENIFYVKLFQIFGTNTKYFNKQTSDYLIKYLDNVPFNNDEEKIEEIHDVIKKISKIDSGLTIDTTNLIQINCGMVAIVYRANMSGKDIVIKVIKNDIEQKILDALDIFYFIIRCIYKLPYLKYYYLMDLFIENKQLILQQINFKIELENTIKFQEDNKNTDYIIIPKVYEEFTNENSNILVLDYLHGVKLNEILEEDKIDYINLFILFSIKSILFNRLYHADLHGGNIIFMNDNNNNKKLGIIDFGIVGNLTKEEQKHYYDFFYQIFKKKCYKEAAAVIVHKFTTKINYNKNIEYDKYLYLKLKHLLKNTFNESFNLDIECIYKLNIILGEYNLKVSRLFCKFELSIAIGDTVAQYLSPENKFLELLENNTNKLINNFSLDL